MKIYNKVVINMATNEIVEEDSFEYEGQVDQCKGGSTKVYAPQPSAEEKALQAEQLKILQTQQAESELMRPYVLAGMGLIEERTPLTEKDTALYGQKEEIEKGLADLSFKGGFASKFPSIVTSSVLSQNDRFDDLPPETTLRRMTEEERLSGMSVLERGQYDLTKMSQERQAKAYAGELPISPALEKELLSQQSQMSEALSQRLGPNWMLTTPGQQAWSAFNQKADLVREESRRGAISAEGGLLLSNLGYLGNVEGQQAQMAAQFPGRTSGMFGGYGVLQQPYQEQRGMELQAAMYSAQAKDAAQHSKESKLYGFWSGANYKGYGGY